MDLGSLLIIIAMLVLVIAFVYRPIQSKQYSSVSQEEQQISELLARRDQVLDALVELEFDQRMGKVPDEVFSVQRSNLVSSGAEILRKLDKYDIAKIEGNLTGGPDPLEAMIAERRSLRSNEDKEKNNYCFNCGEATDLDDLFCANCGADLTKS